jgi:acetolactate synthase-1/2/3 large subunit
MLVVGSKLRSNETFKYRLRLPQPLYRIDADPAQEGRNYASSQFVCGDAALALQGLAERLEQRRAAGGFVIDPAFAADLRQAHDAAARGPLPVLLPVP